MITMARPTVSMCPSLRRGLEQLQRLQEIKKLKRLRDRLRVSDALSVAF